MIKCNLSYNIELKQGNNIMNYKNLNYKLKKYDVYKKNSGMFEIEYFYDFQTTIYNSWEDDYKKGHIVHTIRELYDKEGNTINTTCKLNINNIEEYSEQGTPIKSNFNENDLKIILSKDKTNILNLILNNNK